MTRRKQVPPVAWPDCPTCRARLAEDHMLGAIASVAISHQISRAAATRIYVEQYHIRHEELS